MGTGNTLNNASTTPYISVHPRGHGEHKGLRKQSPPVAGSSPWARGTLVQIHASYEEMRFIPVGTGNTGRLPREDFDDPVHPRGHGEHPQRANVMKASYGSSPWARGTLCSRTNRRSEHRFIPVGTGNTLNESEHQWGRPVHPRGHGEHSCW